MKHSKTTVLSLVLFSVLLSFIGCSSFSTKLPKKGPAPVAVKPVSQIEWKERKWEQYGEDNAGVIYFFDRESITFPGKGVIHVWRKRQLSGSAKSLKEITSFDEIDCRADKFRTLELQGLNPDGTTTEIYKKPSVWTNIFQESADDFFIIKFCGDALKGESKPRN
jgi:hypothetical protein